MLDCVSNGVSNGDAITTKRRKAYPPKYSWFSLYDDQGVGWRRTTTRREDRENGGVPEFLPSLDKGVVSEDSSRKGEKMPWRWAWRRRGSSGSRRFSSQESTSGSYGETVDRDSPQAVELLTLKSLEGPGKRLEILEREKDRRRRKDVYSYFAMPLVRALEAQTGTTTWLRKVSPPYVTIPAYVTIIPSLALPSLSLSLCHPHSFRFRSLFSSFFFSFCVNCICSIPTTVYMLYRSTLSVCRVPTCT